MVKQPPRHRSLETGPETPAAPHGATSAAPRQALLLGASNLTKGLATAVTTAREVLGPEIDLHIAHGHGRSYGRPTRLLGRELPGILQCRLWDSLERSPRGGPPFALVTDIGNDLMYESPLETIVAWVEECFDRLAQSAAQTVVAELPVCNFPLVSERRFRLFRRLLFPRCSLSRAELLRRGEKLNEQVKKLAAARNFFLVAPRAEWYGLDPIHVRRPMRCRAWLELLSRWRPDASIGAAPSASPLVWLYLRTRLPADYRRFGAERQRRQPSGRLQGGARLSVY